jgi:magnesium and cobalt transporter
VGELNSPTPKKTTPMGWLQGWTQRWKRAPRSKADLVQALLAAQQHHIIDMDSRHMLEGVLWMADKTVADVMVAAPKMDLINIEMPIEEMMDKIIDIGHSRYPVYENDKENIIGILMSKDLLKWQRAPEINLKVFLRTAVFVPETKNLVDYNE